jgi:hypothetical protein
VTDDPEITINYPGAETLTFFAKVATSVVSTRPGRATVLWCQMVFVGAAFDWARNALINAASI